MKGNTHSTEEIIRTLRQRNLPGLLPLSRLSSWSSSSPIPSLVEAME